jgi:murein DD-endopeptidase MepM/ murein hydrolase activator NlpD
MSRVKYTYNPKTCKYEPCYLKGRALQDRIAIFIALSFLLAGGFFYAFVSNFDSLNEQLLERENLTLKTKWQILEDRIHHAFSELNVLVEKDDKTYRAILDSEPLSPEIREGGAGGSERFDANEIKNFPTLLYDYTILEKLKSKLEVEIQSFEELDEILNDRVHMWASRPAIQPISNTQLDQLHMSYGARLHPIHKFVREHNGLDFTASKGTPVYATGDGKVGTAHFSATYGNVVYIEHGHGYETRYAHLSKFAVRPGDKVKRGNIIGYVGSTGTSVSSHLHYEVLFHGRHVNPINFFQRDLSNKEYERLIEIGNSQSKALD